MRDEAVAAALAALGRGEPDSALAALAPLGPAVADDALALQVLSLVAKARGDAPDARALLERAVRIAPTDAQAHFNLGVALQGADDLARAVLHYACTLRLAPDHLGALNNQSDLLRRRGRPEEGWTLLQRYRAAAGDTRGLEIRFAKIAMDTRRFDEAAPWFEAAEAFAPENPSTQWEHAMLLLAREDFARGWPRYERRLEVHGFSHLGVYPHDIPRWRGEPVVGRSLLLHREQGLGDMIMFASVFGELLEEGAELHLALHPPLARLMAHNLPRAKVWASFTRAGAPEQPAQTWLEAAGRLDLQAPVCSLGALRRASGFPAPLAYLSAPPEDAATWRGWLDGVAPASAGVRRVGLVLSSRRQAFTEDGRTMGLRKSIPPHDAAGLADAGRTQWISLHDRETAPLLADIAHLDALDPSPWITDLADTAALIANLDLVVSVDTAVAHLAAAMGKPVWLLLQWTPDWRWGLERSDSYWYPHLRIFRQPTPGDWAGVVGDVVDALG